jgi:cellulose synthase/poly-beta-1,6-N-acetylglucosamine synthase-like glycosyltransferase
MIAYVRLLVSRIIQKVVGQSPRYTLAYCAEWCSYYLPISIRKYLAREAYDATLVSIVIPVYCKGRYQSHLASLRTLLSEYLPRQTYSHYEAIVIPDGPDEAVSGMVEQLNDKRIRCYPTKTHQGYWGHQGTRIGISLARGAFFVRMNADNYPFPHYLETLYKGFGEDVGFSYARVEFKDQAKAFHLADHATPFIPEDRAGTLKKGNIDCMNYMVRMSHAKQYRWYWNNSLEADWKFIEGLLRHRIQGRFIDQIVGDKC